MKRYLTVLLMGVAAMIGATNGEAKAAEIKKAYFAGGCFWCMESEFQGEKGVSAVTSGFIGGPEAKSYEEVSSGTTGQVEAVEVVYDPLLVGYERLLKIYWGNIDPLDAGGQMHDRGSQYRTVIFYQDEAERILAEGSKQSVAAKLGKPVVTAIEPMPFFHAAADYHQDYYLKNPDRYQGYVSGSGRKEKLKKIWGEK
jgi:peptide-methionine (S)-S-oxide reductase